MKKLLLVLPLLLSLTLTACDEPKNLETIEDVSIVKVEELSIATTRITVKNPSGEVVEYKVRNNRNLKFDVGNTYDLYVDGAYIRATEEVK